MKSQLIVCFILLAAIAVIFLAGLTVEPGPVSNGNEPTKCQSDIKGKTVCSDNTDDNNSVDASTVNATQVRHQPQYLNDRGNHSGYVVVHYCHEQQTSALKSLFSLQCWAAQLNMPVVEPFVIKSTFQTPLENDVRDLLRFSDLYDMEQWNEAFVKPDSFLPFASWEDFVRNSPRDIILVQTLNSGSTCSFSSIKEKFTSFFKKHHFKIVKEVCLPLEKNKPMTTDKFNHFVLNDYYKLRNVSVIFVKWKGICAKEVCGSSIISVIDSKCDRMTVLDPNTSLKLNLSNRVKQDADLYVHRYLKNSSYISVMLRLEKPIVTARAEEIVSKCTKGVQDIWKKLKNENQLNVTFLGWDVGRFGSASFWQNEKKYDVTQNTQSLFTAIYGHSTSVKEWENTFVDVSGSTNPGYIALLQMSIAARARCVVLIGGGSFQRHALQMYKDLHPQTQAQCIATSDERCRISMQ